MGSSHQMENCLPLSFLFLVRYGTSRTFISTIWSHSNCFISFSKPPRNNIVCWRFRQTAGIYSAAERMALSRFFLWILLNVWSNLLRIRGCSPVRMIQLEGLLGPQMDTLRREVQAFLRRIWIGMIIRSKFGRSKKNTKEDMLEAEEIIIETYKHL